jgi:nucleoid-associated protein YgaU
MKYTVKKGDTLSKIVRSHYGHDKDWREIWRANRGVVGKNPDLIHPGQELDLPDSLFDLGDWLRNLLNIKAK